MAKPASGNLLAQHLAMAFGEDIIQIKMTVIVLKVIPDLSHSC